MTAHKAVAEAKMALPHALAASRGLSKASLRSMLRIELFILDVVIFGAVAFLVQRGGPLFGLNLHMSTAIAVLPIYLIVAFNAGAYSAKALDNTLERVRRSVSAAIIAQISFVVILFFVKTADEISRLSYGVGALSTLLALTLTRSLFGLRVRRLSGGQLWNELLLIDGVLLDRMPRDVQIVRASQLQLEPDLHTPDMLHRFGLIAQRFDRVLIASAPERHATWSIMLKGADVDGEIVTDQSNKLGAIGLGHFGGYDTLQISRKPLNLRSRLQKRALDLAVAIPLLIALLPLLVVIAVAIKMDSRGPVLFRQARVGRGNRMFQILKFRSMRVERLDATGARSASRDDDRITRVGRIIRATSMDELPQLFNVLLGDMSLVGPRPHALGSLAGERKFWEVDPTYWQRHQIKPGITGLAQIRGFRGATNETSDLTSRLQADMEYIQGWDIWRDLSILVNTFRVIIHRNAY